MKGAAIDDRVIDADAVLARITRLEEQLARTPVNSQRRALRAAIRIEANAYRKTLDAAQAAATHDAKRPGTQTLVPRRRIRR